MTPTTIARSGFATVAELEDAIHYLRQFAKDKTMYVCDANGNKLTIAYVCEETLTDGSKVYNVWLG